MSLLHLGPIKLSSGRISSFKIDCDALTLEDMECIAVLLLNQLPHFGSVEGVPSGGLRLAECMKKYITRGPVLIVDDVLTTGKSMERQRNSRDAVGAVIFARKTPNPWITASIFNLNYKLYEL